MNYILPIALIALGLVSIFYIRPKTKNNITEMKFMQTKTVAELRDMFSQMDAGGLGNQYREYVELKGGIVSDRLVTTPFSEREVAYCESSLSQVTEIRETYRDSDGNVRNRVRRDENIISDEKSAQTIAINDGSSKEDVVLEIQAAGCKLDIPETFDRFEHINDLRRYRYFNSFSFNRFGANTIGFKMTEKTIEANQYMYVIGEAFKVGDSLHIGRSSDSKKPFIVTTKSEEEFINSSSQKATFALIGGIVALIAGIAGIVMQFLQM